MFGFLVDFVNACFNFCFSHQNSIDEIPPLNVHKEDEYEEEPEHSIGKKYLPAVGVGVGVVGAGALALLSLAK